MSPAPLRDGVNCPRNLRYTQPPLTDSRGVSNSDLTLLECTAGDETRWVDFVSRLGVDGGGSLAYRGGHLGPRRLNEQVVSPPLPRRTSRLTKDGGIETTKGVVVRRTNYVRTWTLSVPILLFLTFRTWTHRSIE